MIYHPTSEVIVQGDLNGRNEDLFLTSHHQFLNNTSFSALRDAQSISVFASADVQISETKLPRQAATTQQTNMDFESSSLLSIGAQFVAQSEFFQLYVRKPQN